MHRLIKKSLLGIFAYLEFDRYTNDLLKFIWEVYQNKQENLLVKKFTALGLYPLIESRTKDIPLRKFELISPYLVGKKILDVGAGNGKLDEIIQEKLGVEIVLIDTVDINTSSIHLSLYDGKNLPFPDNAFDTSLLIVTLHHCEDPEKVLSETARVTKKRMIITEAVYKNETERKINSFFDWFANRILLRRNIDVPCNYKKPSEWEKLFRKNDLLIIETRDLGWKHQPISPEHRYFFVLDKGM